MERRGEHTEDHLLQDILKVLKDIRRELHAEISELTTIRILFGGFMQGPITLTPATPATTATVLGFDQLGNPFTGPMPSATFTPDVTTFCTFTPAGNSDAVLGTSNGTTNFGVLLTTAEGLVISDSTQIITSGFGVVPVLTTIKLDFTQPA